VNCLSSQAERRRKLGLAPEDPSSVKPSSPVVEEKKVSACLNKSWHFACHSKFARDFCETLNLYIVLFNSQSSLPVRPATKTEQMRECLRTLKQIHKVNTCDSLTLTLLVLFL
jgi:hypothetical protein